METYKDNRLHIECNPEELQTWELMALETNSIQDMCLVLCRYVANGNGPIDKDLPERKALRKLTKGEKNQLMDGQGYEWLENMPVNQIQSVVKAFLDGATETLQKKA
jgi:hypothetical protein